MNLRELNVEPGVYVEYKPTTVLPVGVSVNVLAIIGRSKSTKTQVETLTRKDTYKDGHGDPVDSLSYAVSTGETISKITGSDSRVFEYGKDFLLTNDRKGIDWSLGNNVKKATLVTSVESGFNWATELDSKSLVLEINGESHIINFGNVGSIDEVVNTIDSEINEVATTTKVQDSNEVYQIKIEVKKEYEVGSTIFSSIRVVSGDAGFALGWYNNYEVEGSARPKAGTKYTVSYTRDKIYPDDYTPTYYFNYVDIQKDHGDVDVNNPDSTSLSLGAKIAIENGAPIVLCVPLNPNISTYVGIKEALSKLENYKVTYLVPLSTDTNLLPLIKDHVNRMSDVLERKFRKAMFGLPNESLQNLMNLANSYNDMRLTLVYPPYGYRYEDNTSLKLDASYIACELAAKRCALTIPSISLLRNTLTSFYDIEDTLTRKEKNLLAFSGVTLVEKVPTLNVSRVRDWLTTSKDTLHRNGEIVDIIDYVSERAINIVDNVFIGKAFTDEIMLTMKAFLTNFLESMVLNGILNGYSDITISRNSTEPTQVDVKFKISPIYTLKYVYIQFTI